MITDEMIADRFYFDEPMTADQRAAAVAEMEAEMVEAEIAAAVADCDAEIADSLCDEIEASWNPEERHLLTDLLATRFQWLDAHFRHLLTGKPVAGDPAGAADRLWAKVLDERRIHAF
jgi:hypothetical protein